MINEILESTELLNFDYNQSNTKKISVPRRMLTIGFVAACIYTLLPIIPVL